MANKLTLDALKEWMRDLLAPFNNEKVEITDDTVHSQVLSRDDGFVKSQSSANLYLGGVRWIIWANGGEKVKFASDWIDTSVAQLAEFIMSKQEQ